MNIFEEIFLINWRIICWIASWTVSVFKIIDLKHFQSTADRVGSQRFSKAVLAGCESLQKLDSEIYGP